MAQTRLRHWQVFRHPDILLLTERTTSDEDHGKMSRVSFLQADIERLLRAARKENAVVQIDLRTLVVTLTPVSEIATRDELQGFAPDGEENWDD